MVNVKSASDEEKESKGWEGNEREKNPTTEKNVGRKRVTERGMDDECSG